MHNQIERYLTRRQYFKVENLKIDNDDFLKLGSLKITPYEPFVSLRLDQQRVHPTTTTTSTTYTIISARMFITLKPPTLIRVKCSRISDT